LHNKLTLLVLAAAMLMTASMAQMTGNYTVNTDSSNKTLGTYMVNETGFTLYYFMNDAPGNGTSTCYNACASLWPAFYAENITVPEGLNATDFTDVQREDGMKQTAYKGWPLYFYSKDMKKGDVFGEGYLDKWYVVNPMDFPPIKT
jgi:predicted lipoprotein with Yx(FWY)xxD motif